MAPNKSESRQPFFGNGTESIPPGWAHPSVHEEVRTVGAVGWQHLLDLQSKDLRGTVAFILLRQHLLVG